MLFSNENSRPSLTKALAREIVLKYKKRYWKKASQELKENSFKEAVMTLLDTKANMLKEIEQDKKMLESEIECLWELICMKILLSDKEFIEEIEKETL